VVAGAAAFLAGALVADTINAAIAIALLAAGLVGRVVFAGRRS